MYRTFFSPVWPEIGNWEFGTPKLGLSGGVSPRPFISMFCSGFTPRSLLIICLNSVNLNHLATLGSFGLFSWATRLADLKNEAVVRDRRVDVLGGIDLSVWPYGHSTGSVLAAVVSSCVFILKKDFLRGVLNEDFLRGLSGPQIFERLAVFGMKVQVGFS